LISTFYYLNCEEIRGAIAFGFVLISLPYLEKKQFVKYLIMVLIGCGFHYSNAIFLILPIIPNIFKNKFILIIGLGFCFIGANILQAKFGVYALLIDGLLGVDTVSSYADGDYVDGSGKSLINLINIFITGVLLPLFALYISSQQNKTLSKIFFIYLLCIIGSMVLPLFYRFNHQLSIVCIVVLCRAINSPSVPYKNLKKFILVMCFLIFVYGSISNYLIYNSFLNGYFYENFIPYKIYGS
jgi:hypothetical protein